MKTSKNVLQAMVVATIIASSFIGLLVCPLANVNAQGVGINPSGNMPNASAALDIDFTNKGMLIPRMTTGQRDAISPIAQALMIYNLTTKCYELYENGIWQTIYCAINTPAAAGTINGSSSVCLGQSNIAYSVPAIQYATSYLWAYSGTGATIVGTSNTVSINFSSSATAGNLTVMGNNTLGNGAVSANFPITVNGFPASAGTITGTSTVCPGQSGVAYSITALSNATNYTWSYSGAGVTINGSSNSITINFSASATSGYLTVMGVSPCGNGTVSPNYAITVPSIPSVPLATSGNSGAAHTQTQFVANWSASTPNAATGYYLDVSTTSNFSSFVTGFNNLDVLNVTSYNVTGLSCGTTYYYRVRGYNSCGANGTSANSNTVIFSTTNCFSITAPGITPTISGVNTLLTFTTATTTTATVTGSGNIQLLVVAGGGAGGSNGGGGGGAGGFIYNSSYAVVAQGYTVTVGAGGTGVSNNNGNNGANSAFGTGITAIGGGGGGGFTNSGKNGGSGGGAAGSNGSSCTGGTATSGQGNAGGSNTSCTTPPYNAAGGGGAGAAGTGVVSCTCGAGGTGLQSSISGTSVFYAGGGGGGSYSGSGCSGGVGGGGAGTGSGAGTPGTANTGGGGGGSAQNGTGATGGSGVVIISYLTP